MPPNAAKISSILLGNWRLERRIEPGGTLVGTAIFKPQGKGQLLYTEEGVLTTNLGQAMRATQSYLYVLSHSQLKAYFTTREKALFHCINWADFKQTLHSYLSSSAKHLCGQDCYETRYEFFTPEHFIIHHRVQGPKKNYISQTIYWKI